MSKNVFSFVAMQFLYKKRTLLVRSMILLVAMFAVVACEKTMPLAPEEDQLLDGPIDGLTAEQQSRFLSGDIAFGEVFTIADGLGPIFVANQCASCHPGDGKGSPFVRFTRFGQSDDQGNQYLHLGGPQLQHKAIPGYQPEELPAGAPFTDLIAPAVTGLGYLDAVSDADILAIADPNDSNNDGISGAVNWNNIPDYVQLRPNTVSQGGKYITRFGKKAAAYDLLHQTSGAYNQDMGITSMFEPIDPYSGLVEDPEVSTQTVNNVVFYLKTLKAPIQRNAGDPDVQVGEILFRFTGCAKCHVPRLETGFSPIDVLSYKKFYPYTDMLLHDMGPGLDDGYTEGFAETYEWRTPALWGLGLSPDAQGGGYFLLHDGRATSIESAILMHGGEAEKSKDRYVSLTSSEKAQLLKFLESL